ncbi:hypothetical protein Tco_1393029 [Tanacetum coccineum]
MALAALEWGKGLSLKRGPSFYLGHFHAAIRVLSVEVLLREHLNAKPCGKGRENSKYRCRCWDCTCRFSLLSVLNEKGKDYVFKDEIRKARDVFLENMCFVVSLSSLPSSESPRTLCELFELVMRREIRVVHATHIAELIYIISWVACTMGESDGDFLTSNEMLIATLKHVLILLNCTTSGNHVSPKLLQQNFIVDF